MRLLPSLRQKKRYVLLEIISDKKFSFPEIQEEVEKAFLRFWGILGVARASPLLVKEKFSLSGQKLVVKVNHAFVDELKMALALSTKIKNTPIILRSISTSGSLKKASTYL